jgi:hypothetical protein
LRIAPSAWRASFEILTHVKAADRDLLVANLAGGEKNLETPERF